MSRLVKALLFAQMLAVLQACTSATVMPDAVRGEPAAGNVVVVGKFKLNPPLSDIEKDYSDVKRTFGLGNVINKIFVSATPQPITSNFDKSLMSEQWKNSLRSTWGEIYFRETKAEKTYLNFAMLYTDPYTMDKAILPGGLSFTPPADASAIYIGTVKYTRDDFWNITKVEVIDEYEQANAEFKKRFGNSMQLRKALLQ